MQKIDLAVIGGTGVYALAALENVQTQQLQTPYGAPSGPVRIGHIAGKQVAFLARHGEGHSILPHQINYRANLYGLHQLGVKQVLALNTVGGISAQCPPQMLVCPDQLIDYTTGRISTFGEEPGAVVQHVDFGQPYSKTLRKQLMQAAADANVAVVDGGCYGATQGPRLETCAEIARMRRDGCDLVGMTGMPEAALARELALEYACLAVVANWAAGAGTQPDEIITMDEVLANVDAAMQQASVVLHALLHRL